MNIRESIRGPVYPIPMPFADDGSIDAPALGAYSDHLLNEGARILLMTVGTSRFNLLDREEMHRANAIVARAASGRGLFLASGPGPNSGSLAENILFAQRAADAGASALMAVFPERYYGDDVVVNFYLRLADASPIPVCVHAQPFRDGFGGIHATKPFGLSMLSRIAEHQNIGCVKEENGVREMFEEILAGLNPGLPVIGAGGAMRRHLKDAALGSVTYLVGVESIVPRLGPQFFEAVHSGDTAGAEAIAAVHEDPFFQQAVAYGWHRSLKAALAIVGLMPFTERDPFPALNADEYKTLESIARSCGWV
jgi:4-hydroxy-tetrahydrodipicolinate synthase